jgi:NAD(P)-dependent dehydrogenase (short-subunit alcohol dehydrogenase family)
MKLSTQQPKIAIVTGANTGLGYWNTLDLSLLGYTVIMACRNPDKAAKAREKILKSNPAADLNIMTIDLSSFESVRNFAKGFIAGYQRLDLLINNAGIMLVPYAVTEDGLESTMAANYFGHFLLTGLLLDVIKQTPDSRVISLSSLAHENGNINLDDINSKKEFNSFQAYAQSKLACLMFAYELQRRFDQAGIKTLSVAAHPGLSSTDLSRHLPIPDWATSLIFNTVGKVFGQSAEEGSKSTLLAATDKEARGGDYYGPSGFRGVKGKPAKVTSSELSHDQELAKKLWEISEEITGVSYKF